MSDEEFRHERLKLSGSFMRLLQVQGGTNKDVISLRITQYAIHRRPPYVAISYTWGNAGETRKILVNGRPFRVRINLWNLLQHLRQRGESRFLWIDALSIDQQNLEERNYHVQLMCSIYDRSERAIVWLGLPSDDRRQARAMEFVAEMAAFCKTHSTLAYQETYLRSEKCVQRWTNLLELCRGAYWTRTWIIQEFLQATYVEVVCGTARLDWKDFEHVVRTIRELHPSLVGSHGGLGSGSLPLFLRQFVQTLPFRLTSRRISHTESTLEELLSEFYDSKCAERRDKVYGILGIADDCGEDPVGGGLLGPQPDYSKHIVQVYFEVFEYLRPSNTRAKLPLQAVYLAQRALEISQADIAGYVALLAREEHERRSLGFNTRLGELRCPLVPDYVNPVDEVVRGWTSVRDLRQRLEQFDWSRYVGHEVKRKPSRPLPTPSSSSPSSQQRQSSFTKPLPSTTTAGRQQTTYIRAPLPPDLIENMIQTASHSDEIRHLHNYPSAHGCTIPIEQILLHAEDKRRTNNDPLTKPSVVIESNPALGVDPVRLGFACTDVRAGDLICQFKGVDITFVARRVGGDEALKLVGTARMVGHVGLSEKGIHPGCRRAVGPGDGGRQWSGIVHENASESQSEGRSGNAEGWEMLTDPASLWELLSAA